jgi:CBS domain-containing protein
MRGAEVSAALVGSGDAIVTEGDLTRALAAGLGPETPLSSVAVANPVVVDPDVSVVAAAEEMMYRHVHHLVVRDRTGSVQGIVSEEEVLLALLEVLDPGGAAAHWPQTVTSHAEIWLG